MPTCTLPYEVLLEFTNDTHDAATLQLMRGEDTSPGGGAMILLQRRESVSLVLNAGAAYQYTLRQGEKAAKISVRTWRDIQCNAAHILSINVVRDPLSGMPIEGMTITDLTLEE